MSLLQYQRIWDDGQPGWGRHSFNDAINAGYSGSDISNFVNSGQIRIGQKALDMAYGAGAASRGNQLVQQQYESQLQGYRNQLDDYTRQVNAITGQYQTALGDVNRLTGEVQDWTGKFQQSQSAYEAAKAQADAYKEEAVSRQLSGLRTGTTGGAGGGNNYDPYGLATGEPRYRTGSPAEENLVSVKQDVDPTDSVLSHKGPVVQAIRTGSATGPSTQEKRAPVSTGSGSYYASRFG